jgi:mannose-1-phosphate guanylyltransferase
MILIPTILCGGAGSRLWPLSRSLHPKPFIKLNDGQSLLQKAFIRGAQQNLVKEVLTVTNRELLFKTEDDYREVNKTNTPTSFILEPFGKNTAAAIAAATLEVIENHGEEAQLLVLAADHLIKDSQAFEKAVTKAIELADKGSLVTFGIEPTTPETGYGYIETDGHMKVQRFVEKPDLETAKQYMISGRHLWNSGMFCFKAGVMLREMQQHCPDIINAVDACLKTSQKVHGNGIRQVELNPENFKSVAEDSIDFAVFEKSSNIAVIPCNIGWSDIGSWSAMGELTPADNQGNRVDGKALLVDSRNCFIRSKNRMVGAVGLDNIIVVDTADALLVVNENNAQDVRRIYSALKKSNHEVHKLHRTVYRPWGHYTVLEEGEHFKIKRIQVKPHSSLSLQLHRHRSEHWVVIKGEARIVNGENELTIQRNESTFIPAGHKHRLCNPTDGELVIIEVQTGKYVGEDDIIRFEDKYGRC